MPLMRINIVAFKLLHGIFTSQNMWKKLRLEIPSPSVTVPNENRCHSTVAPKPDQGESLRVDICIFPKYRTALGRSSTP